MFRRGERGVERRIPCRGIGWIVCVRHNAFLPEMNSQPCNHADENQRKSLWRRHSPDAESRRFAGMRGVVDAGSFGRNWKTPGDDPGVFHLLLSA
jgi:hypothetical protein